jgi:1,4-dihydroxy-2-naphthoate polyprenyltransferase
LTIKNWLEAFRLRTLTLSLSCILIAFTAAFINNTAIDYKIVIFTIITTVFLQILSNVANDLGDFISGADGIDRVGPERMTSSGKISKQQMTFAVVFFSIASLVSGSYLLYLSRNNISVEAIAIMFLIGLGAIAAAIKYTVGKSPYGYMGLGDVFVFIFFGLVGVGGSYFLFTGEYEFSVLFPSITMGFLSMGVLNLNNMRDYYSDKKNNKNTIVVKIGLEKAFIYHALLIIFSQISILTFVVINFSNYFNFIFLLASLLLFLSLKRIKSNLYQSKELDPELKKLAITTLLLNILLLVGFVISN